MIWSFTHMEGYKKQFNDVQAFFKDRLLEGNKQSAELIRRLMTE
jgi:prephenate dehydrogenase (NADP+)